MVLYDLRLMRERNPIFQHLSSYECIAMVSDALHWMVETWPKVMISLIFIFDT